MEHACTPPFMHGAVRYANETNVHITTLATPHNLKNENIPCFRLLASEPSQSKSASLITPYDEKMSSCCTKNFIKPQLKILKQAKVK